jgi:CRISPR-associated protein Cas1
VLAIVGGVLTIGSILGGLSANAGESSARAVLSSTGATQADLALYQAKAEQYQVGWKGRSFTPGKFEMSDVTNQIITSTNAALYGILCSGVHSMGYSPQVGFIHSGSPLPFVYDLADLYKADLCIDLAFWLTRELAGRYDKHKVAAAFRRRVIEMDLLSRLGDDIATMLGGSHARRPRQ